MCVVEPASGLRQLPGVCTMYCDCYVTAGAEAEAGNTAPRVPWYYLSPRFTGDKATHAVQCCEHK